MPVKKTVQVSQKIESLDISIPFELAKYTIWQRSLVKKHETNQVIRAIDTWLILKHLTSSGHIQQWNEQKEYLLKMCKCSESVFRHRLQLLESMQLISLYKINRKKDSIRICSWETLSKIFLIKTDNKITIQYNANDNQKIQYWLIAAEIQDNKNWQDLAIIRKLKKNIELYNAVIIALLKEGADRNRLNDMQYFLMYMRIVYRNDFIQVSEIHNELIEVRPDNNRSTKGIANAWNCKHPVTISYWKNILKKTGVIDISSIQIESQERVRNKQCKVLWLKQRKQTLLCLCDQIELLRPWLYKDQKFLPAA